MLDEYCTTGLQRQSLLVLMNQLHLSLWRSICQSNLVLKNYEAEVLLKKINDNQTLKGNLLSFAKHRLIMSKYFT